MLFTCLLAISTQEVIETNCGNKYYEFKSVISLSVTQYFLFAPCKGISDREVREIFAFGMQDPEILLVQSGILAFGIQNTASH